MAGRAKRRVTDSTSTRGGSAIQAAGVIAVAVVLRLAASHFVGLGTDESYSVAVARDLQLSYFDHPPMQYWLVHAIAPLASYGRVSRWPFIVLFAASSWLMFALTRRLFGERAGLWAVLALNLAGFFAVAAGDWVLPDGPLIFFLLAAAAAPGRRAVVAACCVDPEPPRPRCATWLWVGFWIGFAALSKYQAALFCVGLRTVYDRHGPRPAPVRPDSTLAPMLAALLSPWRC